MHDEQIYPKIYIGRNTELYIDQINEVIESCESMEVEKLRETLLTLGNKRVKVEKVASV